MNDIEYKKFKIRLEVILWLLAIALPFFKGINSDVFYLILIVTCVTYSITFIILALLLRFQPPALGSDTEITLMVIIGTFLAVMQSVFLDFFSLFNDQASKDISYIVPGGPIFVLFLLPPILGTFIAEGIIKVKNFFLDLSEHSKSLEITLWLLSIIMLILFSILNYPIYSSLPFIILTVFYKLKKINSIKTVFWLMSIFLITPIFSFAHIFAPNTIFVVPYIVALFFCMVWVIIGFMDFMIELDKSKEKSS